MNFISNKYNELAKKLDRTEEEVKIAFEDAKNKEDYHLLITAAANNLGEDAKHLWRIMTRIWSYHNKGEDKVKGFYNKFEEAVNKILR